MAAPIVFNYRRIWVRGRFANLSSGAPVVGRHLQCIPSPPWLRDAQNRLVLAPDPVIGVTDSGGWVTVALTATDDPALSPVGWTWTIQDPLRRTYPLPVPYDTPIYHAPTPLPGQLPDPLDGMQVIDLGSDVFPDAEPSAGTVLVRDGASGPMGPRGIQGVPGPTGPQGGGLTQDQLNAALVPYATTASLPSLGFLQAISTPQTTVQLVHNLTYRPAGVTCIDTQGNHVLWLSKIDPQPGVTEIGFGFGFTGTIELS